jgi:TRAP-type mannitol/chloroaromatic compound transport system permease small subunit
VGDRADVRVLLGASRAIDWINEQFGAVANWLILLACLISAGNAFSRYLFSESSNGWLEIQWYMFAGVVLLGGPYTLKMNEHVRVDLLYGMVSERTRIWIDILGGLFFLLPICVLLGGPYTLKMNEHVRVDLLYGMVSERTRIWIDILGGLFFLLPICVLLVYFTWPWFVDSWRINEMSTNAGGLVRWPVKLMMPVGFALMALQGISEIIKRIAALEHVIDIEFKYEKPLQ